MEMKPQAQPRPYQEKSLSKMFGNGKVPYVSIIYFLFECTCPCVFMHLTEKKKKKTQVWSLFKYPVSVTERIEKLTRAVNRSWCKSWFGEFGI